MSVRMNKALPWLIIVFGFLTLASLPPFIGWGIMTLGIIMLVLRRWPEKWGAEDVK